jgi:NADH-quinone oxidoreductase subunit N
VSDLVGALPVLILVLVAAAVLAFDRFFPADERAAAWLATAGALAAGAAAAFAGTGDDALGGLVRRDGAAVFLTSVLCASTAAILALDAGLVRPSDAGLGGRLALTLVAAAAATVMVVTADLLLLFAAVEILFMSLFALIAGSRSPRMPAASRSFFVLGGTALPFLAFGIGLVWSETGSFGIGALAAVISPVGQAGTALVLVGLACFAGLVPFHFWLPAALEALPAPTAAVIAIVPRVAAFAALMRCAGAITANGGSEIDWRACVAILAAASLALGSLSALSERSLKPLVAQLAIAFGGQIAVAAAAGVVASTAIALAVLAYAVVVIGLFGFIAMMRSVDPQLTDLGGLARRRPLLVVALAILVVGMAGLPPTMVFFARLAVFEGAVVAQLAWLVIFAGIATVVTAASCARILFACFEAGEDRLSPRRVVSGIVVVAALITIAGGIAPGPLVQLAQGVRF